MQVLAERRDITWAAFAKRSPAFASRTRRPTGAQAAGLRFERQALQACELRYGGLFLSRPWFMYMVEQESSCRWCQPDGLLFDFSSGVITIVEVKIRHTAAAWEKLNGLYRGVVETLFPTPLWQIAVCELTRMFDCAVVCVEKPVLHDAVDKVRVGEFGVVTWKPLHSS